MRTRTPWAVDYGIGRHTDRGTRTASALRTRSRRGRATRRAAALKRMCSLAALRSLQCRKLHRRCTLIAARVFSSLKRLVLRTQSKILRREKSRGGFEESNVHRDRDEDRAALGKRFRTTQNVQRFSKFGLVVRTLMCIVFA